MLIDCDTCVGRGVHCHDCVVMVLLTSAPQPERQYELDGEEQIALVRLAEAGLVPPLRLVRDDTRDSRPDRGIA